MKSYPFKKLDAFATTHSAGNPAGYVLLDSDDQMTEDQMQLMARQLKGFVNEVGYVWQTGARQFRLKYYSSEREVDFCGHATLAIFYDLFKHNKDLRRFNTLEIVTNCGISEIENRLDAEDAVYIMSPEPEEGTLVPGADRVAFSLQMSHDAIDTRFPIQVIHAGLWTLIVPVTTLQSVLAIEPDLEQLKTCCENWGIDIVLVFTPEVVDLASQFRTRVFAPTFGYLEDPATGSGNSALGYYLMRQGRWQSDSLIIEQNGEHNSYNIVKLKKKQHLNGERVLFGGAAITRIEGAYLLYE